jgi:hypothetical protein
MLRPACAAPRARWVTPFKGNQVGHRHANPTGSSHHRQLVFQTMGIAVHLDHHVAGTKRGALLNCRQDDEMASTERSTSTRKPSRLKVG